MSCKVQIITEDSLSETTTDVVTDSTATSTVGVSADTTITPQGIRQLDSTTKEVVLTTSKDRVSPIRADVLQTDATTSAQKASPGIGDRTQSYDASLYGPMPTDQQVAATGYGTKTVQLIDALVNDVRDVYFTNPMASSATAAVMTANAIYTQIQSIATGASASAISASDAALLLASPSVSGLVGNASFLAEHTDNISGVGRGSPGLGDILSLDTAQQDLDRALGRTPSSQLASMTQSLSGQSSVQSAVGVMNDAADKLSSPNLVPNADVSDGLTAPWTAFQTVTLSLVTDSTVPTTSGNSRNVIECVCSSSQDLSPVVGPFGSYGGIEIDALHPSIQSGASVAFSFYVKSSSGTMTLHIGHQNGSFSTESNLSGNVSATSSWSRVSISTGALSATRQKILIYNVDVSGGTFTICDVQLELATSPSPFQTPATAAAVAAIAQTASTVVGEIVQQDFRGMSVIQDKLQGQTLAVSLTSAKTNPAATALLQTVGKSALFNKL